MDPKSDPQKMSKGSAKGSKREPQLSQKGVQTPVKNQSKIETKTRPVLDTKKEVFGEAKPAPYMELSSILRFWDVYRHDAN